MSRRPAPLKSTPAPVSQASVLDDVDADGDEDSGVDTVIASPSAGPVRELDHRVEPGAHGRRLDQMLVGLAGEFSRSHLQSLIERGCVQLDGQVVQTPSRKVHMGQRLQARLEPTAESQAFVAEPMDLAIVFEDEHLLIVNKPAGMVVHPAAGNWSGTLMNGLLAHHTAAAGLPRAGIVHRLDKDTSGLMVVGKSLQACTALVRVIAARDVHRQYRAIVWGRPPAQLRIDAPVGRDPVSRVRMAVVASGRPAMTDVETLGTIEHEMAERPRAMAISAVQCTLHTGRTHQIRVHLSSRGWPLLADALYGGVPALGLERQALHAARLRLAHPVTGLALDFEADLPADMATAWAQVVHNEAESV